MANIVTKLEETQYEVPNLALVRHTHKQDEAAENVTSSENSS